jgi:hypothetical protein
MGTAAVLNTNCQDRDQPTTKDGTDLAALKTSRLSFQSEILLGP